MLSSIRHDHCYVDKQENKEVVRCDHCSKEFSRKAYRRHVKRIDEKTFRLFSNTRRAVKNKTIQ